MTDQLKKRWIVLVDKSPRGPFTEEEINDLLKQQLLQRNDLAFLISNPGQSEGGTWKFLWQFSCFDLRQNEAKVPPPAAILEKRTQRTEAEVQTSIQDSIPVDLKSIQIEELIVRAGQGPKKEFNFSKALENKMDEDSHEGPKESAFASSAASFALVLVAVAGMGVVGYREIKKIRTTSDQAVVRDTASSENDRAKPGAKAFKAPEARKSGGFPSGVLGVDKGDGVGEAPKARDRGDIREEELLRAREEERRREAEERERIAREEEEERRRQDAQENEEDDKDKSAETRRKANRELGSEDGETSDETPEANSRPQEVLED